MHKFCPNCGDPVEEDEIFCDKCGTKIESDGGGQDTNQQYTQNTYQPSQTPNQNYYQNQNQHNTGQQSFYQQNAPQYTPNPQFQQQYTKPKKSFGKKLFMIITTTISVIAVLLVVLGIIGSLAEKHSYSDNNPKIITPTPQPTAAPTAAPTATPTPATSKALAIWSGNINAKANYNASEKKILVDYSLQLKDIGTGKASNINVYLDPVQGDSNASYLGITSKEIVNIEGPVASIGAGEAKPITTQFFYDNIEQASATQETLQKVANSFIAIPLLVEWQENGKPYTQKLTIQ